MTPVPHASGWTGSHPRRATARLARDSSWPPRRLRGGVRRRGPDPPRTRRSTTPLRISPAAWSLFARGRAGRNARRAPRAARIRRDRSFGNRGGTVLDVLNLGGILAAAPPSIPSWAPVPRRSPRAVLAFDDLGTGSDDPRTFGTTRSPRGCAERERAGGVRLRHLHERGRPRRHGDHQRVRPGRHARGPAKLTGVALMRDSLSMLDAGAFERSPSTTPERQARTPGCRSGRTRILNRLAEHEPEVIVASWETGSSVNTCPGHPRRLRTDGARAAHVVAAPDPVGAGARRRSSARDTA